MSNHLAHLGVKLVHFVKGHPKEAAEAVVVAAPVAVPLAAAALIINWLSKP